MTAPPRESKEAGNKLYTPLANHLSKLLNAKVVYQHPGNWLNYQRDMREDKYDIVFDGPHFISWRLEHLKH
ncbi:MAG: phosphate/phosphite/phosphonate ABC transporter substrate-binding protein, partial [Gammaproteobacteria bacterium]|nr:phosphate/phosphite/phosphonate ABC transporter substrate-binding protein [Gammaproteobacteria bacterium]